MEINFRDYGFVDKDQKVSLQVLMVIRIMDLGRMIKSMAMGKKSMPAVVRNTMDNFTKDKDMVKESWRKKRFDMLVLLKIMSKMEKGK